MEQNLRKHSRKEMTLMGLEATISLYEEMIPEDRLYFCKKEAELIRELYPDNDLRKAYLNVLINEFIRLNIP